MLSCSPAGEQQAERIIAELKQAYAPDKRVALFDVHIARQGEKLLLTGETNLPAAHRALLDRLRQTGINVLDSVAVLPAKEVSGTPFGVVRVSVANVRTQPKHSAEMATQALLGSVLRIWRREGDFYLVQTPDDYFGWIDLGAFVPLDTSAMHQYLRSERLMVTADHSFVYQSASVASQKVSDLVAGCLLLYNGTEGAFYQVHFADGRNGYVPVAAAQLFGWWLQRPDPTPNDIIATALDMMGRPYLWGGTSTMAMDCSGFTKTSYFLNGVQLARDASQQVNSGELLPRDTTLQNLQPGDLLFFGRPATDSLPEKIWHVAIYFGDGRIIHAVEPGIKLESLRRNDPAFNEKRFDTWVKSRRIISAIGQKGITPVRELAWYTGAGLPD